MVYFLVGLVVGLFALFTSPKQDVLVSIILLVVFSLFWPILIIAKLYNIVMDFRE